MGRGNWWMLASPVQVPRKWKGDMEGLSPALQASTGGYRSILEQVDQCMYVCILIDATKNEIILVFSWFRPTIFMASHDSVVTW